MLIIRALLRLSENFWNHLVGPVADRACSDDQNNLFYPANDAKGFLKLEYNAGPVIKKKEFLRKCKGLTHNSSEVLYEPNLRLSPCLK